MGFNGGVGANSKLHCKLIDGLMDDKSKELCPRLIDFLVIVGRKPDSKLQKAPPIGAHVHPNDVPQLRRRTGFVGVANPEILRRYPTDNHKDFALPTDVTYFCQPEGCVTVADNYQHNKHGHETTSFIFMLTEKDTSKIRYGITLNFFLHFEPKPTHTTTSGNPAKRRPTASMTSLCLISHHPFLSTFAELLRLLAQLIDACNMRCNYDDSLPRDSLWMVLTGHWTGPIPQIVMQEVKQIETWILLLLSSPVPVPGKTKLVLEILPEEVMKMQEFGLPDYTRFTMVDFPLHLPLELLSTDTVITLLTAVMLEHKVVLQSRNYNAVSMCVLSLVALLYPLEYMFPVIPLLPTFLQNAEQILLAPTPFIIGVPASFFLCKGIKLPEDVILVDLDTNEVTIPDDLSVPDLPEPERSNLKQDFLVALGKTTSEFSENKNGSFEASYQNDPDEIDVACRIAMINFFNSPNIFANFSEHTRTLRLYPRPVVALQTESFLRSRPYLSTFIQELCKTQSVEYFAEECLCPRNEVYVRVQNGTTSAKQVGDKLKWFGDELMPVHFNAYPNNCTLVEALNTWHLARNAHGLDEEEDQFDWESNGMDESMLTMSPFSEHAPDFEATKPVSEVNDVYQAPNKLQLPQSLSRLSIESSISSGRSSPASTNSEAGNDSEADFARLAENLAIKSNEKGDFDFDHVGDSTESTPVQNRKAPLGPSVLSSNSSTPTSKGPQFKIKGFQQAFSDSGEKVFGPNIMNTLNGYAEKSHGMLGSFFSKTAPKAHALREKTMRPLEAAANKIEHGQHLIQNKRQNVQQDSKKEKDSTQAAQLQMKNQQTIRDMCDQVLAGQGVGVFQSAKLKRLLEDESLRELVCQKLNLGVSQRYTEEDFLQRVQLSRAQYKGYLKILQACLHGLEHSYNSPHSDGLASLFHVLEIAHTHFWAENESHTPGSGISSLIGTPTSSIHTILSPAGPSHKSSLASIPKTGTDPVPFTTTGPTPLQPGVETAKQQKEQDLVDFNVNTPQTSDLISLSNVDDGTGSQNGGSANGTGGLLDSANNVVPSTFNDQNNEMTRSTDTVTSEPPKSLRRPSETPAIPPRRPSDTRTSPRIPPPVPQRGAGPPPLPKRPPPLPERPASSGSVGSVSSPRKSLTNSDPPVLPPPVLPPPALEPVKEVEGKHNGDKGIEQRDDKADKQENKVIGSVVSDAVKDKEDNDNFGKEDGQKEDKNEEKPAGNILNGDIKVTKPVANGHVKAAEPIEKPKSLFVAKPSTPSSSSSSTLEPTRHFLYQDLISASNGLWANMVFWENAFFDMVAKERDIIGMDQEPSEMIDRYSSLNDSERKRLELDEDRIIAVLLHNMTAYMVMCGSPTRVLQQKVRRMLGKAHIGLIYSKKINQLLDELPSQPSNLIQLKPLGSRLVQKQSFAVHVGDSAEAPVSFMEVCDDAVIIRACNGQITERWWYERLVNMTYSPRTRVLCIWRRQDDQVHMHKFHTKKCRQLYTCMKTAMEKAAQRGKVTIAGRDLGGEFPVHDIETSEGGLLQVRIDGVKLLFADRQDFISLSSIKKCNTFGGNMFVLEEYNKQRNQLIQRRYISTMARHVAWALHRMFSVRLTLNETLARTLADEDTMSGVETPVGKVDDNGYEADKSFCSSPMMSSPMISPKRKKLSEEILKERLNLERPKICIQNSVDSNTASEERTPTASPSYSTKKRRRRKLSQISFEHTSYPNELRFITRLTSGSDEENTTTNFPYFTRQRAPSHPAMLQAEERVNVAKLCSSVSMDTALNVWPRQEADNEVIEMEDLTPRTEVLPEIR
ncbi:unnamed protein product [Bursaphelenchus okinawaensis]|uniref:MAP kinase-activating death domain protein n=1 Tax=Bursaphelenchus okinawaensis TaxID=465554 RepID=A0A811KD97_9BILA|nr:unnamed protein product [Bursaphelenchus okinawaensis]CAG9102486.1 unnamed protein product [Bursaphelenchus okinawaensis]